MRILHVITEMHEGGAENALGETAAEQLQRGHEVLTVALYGEDGAVAGRLRRAGVRVVGLGVTRPYRLRRGCRLRTVADEFRPDIAHAWLFHAGMAARLLLPRRLPLICGLRVCEPRLTHVIAERLTRWLVDRYLCVSPAVAEFARERLGIPPDRLSVVTNGVRLPEVLPPARNCDRLRGLTVGRLTRQKGMDILLRALARLPAELTWDWQVIGAAPDARLARELKQLATALGIAERITWRGQVERDAMPDVYGAANCLALTSRWEGQPNVVLEAMAYRVPVVATAVDGVLDLERERPGAVELVAPEDPGAVADGVLRVLRQPERRRQRVEQGAALAASRSWDQVCNQVLNCYNEACAAVGMD